MGAPSAGAGLDLAELADYLDRLLSSTDSPDSCPNGLQVAGPRRVSKLVTGVSACHELFRRARAAGADAVLVHHGLFWEGTSRRLTGVQYRRVAELIEGEIALLAYHLPLDRHPELGNNAVAARELGLRDVVPFGIFDAQAIGCAGRFGEPLPAAELTARCRAVFGSEPLAFLAGPDPVRTLGVVSGAAQKALLSAISAGLDAFVTGEVSEWVMNVAREAGIHFLAAGHYATERLGVRELGRHLAARFGIEVEFIDVPNPV
jgi:dinuclear metal center YbgI/SA1388 family protein